MIKCTWNAGVTVLALRLRTQACIFIICRDIVPHESLKTVSSGERNSNQRRLLQLCTHEIVAYFIIIDLHGDHLE